MQQLCYLKGADLRLGIHPVLHKLVPLCVVCRYDRSYFWHITERATIKVNFFRACQCCLTHVWRIFLHAAFTCEAFISSSSLLYLDEEASIRMAIFKNKLVLHKHYLGEEHALCTYRKCAVKYREEPSVPVVLPPVRMHMHMVPDCNVEFS